MSTHLRALLAALLATGALCVLGAAPAMACGDDYGSSNNGGGTVVSGGSGCDDSSGPSHPSGPDHPYVPSGPPAPVYEDYWTPACSANGPPNQGADAMCMAAVSVCDSRGEKDAIFMQHWRREVAPGATWELVGNVCKGPDEPTQQQPQVTQEMVLDQAYAAAPRPTAMVQPGNRSYVNLPNNYYADAPGETRTVTVLGHPIQVVFTVNQISWDFGDGQSGTGKGDKDASVGAAGAVEHAYGHQGSYSITATSSVGVRFTLPDGQTVNTPNAFSFTSDPVALPIGEIQTRVDATG